MEQKSFKQLKKKLYIHVIKASLFDRGLSGH